MRQLHPRSLLAWWLLIALLAGCGQKGPLYLPDKPSQSSPAQQNQTTKP
ncbi:MAG TPA: lipoprotein [Candidatus Competibacter sp.]|nr:lipoprotein [Candidatus Competibacter sp.]HRF64081.1 lipoprotein [Candidatus Competibacter sp.]HRX59704.1 lipoprotein [Candidatus Competibacter sp.]HUM89895.1 lipoprotein [Candidatus Competibacter sp.]